MPFNPKYLSDDETVVFHLRTHIKQIFGPLLLLVLVVVAAGLGATLVDDQPILRWGIVGVAVVIIAIWVFWPIVNWLTTTYTVTDQRLITRSGVLTRVGRDIPHEHIHDVAYEQSVLDRILRCGTLVVSSASEEGTVRLHDVPGVHVVQLRLSELVRESNDFNRPDASDASEAEPQQ
jgi:uncharacterized membrane protein YdbT with pleckstrin-like domain